MSRRAPISSLSPSYLFRNNKKPRARDRRRQRLSVESLENRRVMTILMEPIGGYETDIFDQGAAEGVGYSVASERLFVGNQSTVPATESTPEIGPRIDVVDASDPTNPVFEFSIDVSAYGAPTSVATYGELVAVAIPNGTDRALPGVVMFLDAHTEDGVPLRVMEVGPNPDHVVFTPDGGMVLTANEGQDGDAGDPEGSISVIDVSAGIQNAEESKITFTEFNGKANLLRAQGVRFLTDEDGNIAQSFEPEYIAVHPNSNIAWVAMQENSAIAKINLQSGNVSWIRGLGHKDHSLPGNGLDPSDRDDGVNINNWPVLGTYQPDGITVFSNGDDLYLATANEGDGFSGESTRVGSLDLDDTVFPNEAELKENANLGRLNVSGLFGDTDGDGDVDKLYSFGGRSFSIWTPGGQQVFDSGDQLEQITAAAYPDNFNPSNTNNDLDNRSDDRGPEPTTIVVGDVGGHQYGFLTIERTGGVMVWDMADPTAPSFVQYVNTRDFNEEPGPGTAGGDLHPENLVFVKADDSPTGNPLLIVSYQVSGSVRIFEINDLETGPAAAVPALSQVASRGAGQSGGDESEHPLDSLAVDLAVNDVSHQLVNDRADQLTEALKSRRGKSDTEPLSIDLELESLLDG